MTHAPIVLFVYNRPAFTRRTLEALAANHGAGESELFIFSDGPATQATAAQRAAVSAVRQVIRERSWCRKVHIMESEHNKGLASSVISGVTQVIRQYGKVIVIEDDVMTSPFFLPFMNEALEKYSREERVLSIGSWNYYYHTGQQETYFSRLPDTIAWATWQRAWDLFEPDAEKLMQLLKQRGLMDRFNMEGQLPFEAMLQDQLDGKVSSWAIRWTAVAVLKNTLTLYPVRSLSKHIGFGHDSTHVKSADYNEDLLLANSPIVLRDLPLSETKEARDALIHFEKHIKPIKTSKKEFLKHIAKRFLKLFGWNR